ncbi:MAG: NUDIX domain-containing protein [Candidatus Saliniplasma sp.]
MEYLDVVDEQNRVIDQRPRKEVHEKGLPHRTVMFFVRSPEGKYLVTKRSEDKEFFPGYWSVVMGGHVQASESYEASLDKEMREEIGVKGDYKELGSFVKDIPEETEHVKLYEVIVEPDDIELLDKEFKKGEFWDKDMIIEELDVEVDKRKFLPETEIVLKYL